MLPTHVSLARAGRSIPFGHRRFWALMLMLSASAVTARADYQVQGSTADQGRVSRVYNGDSLCNLAEAIDSVKRGYGVRGCVDDGGGYGNAIALDSYAPVNGVWQPANYKLLSTSVIDGTVRIYSSGNGNASIEGSAEAGTFIVRSGATLDVRYVNVKHAGKGRVITNHGNLEMFRSAIQNGDVDGLSGVDNWGVETGHGGGLYNDGFANFTETTVEGNAAAAGGGIYSTAPFHAAGKIILVKSTVNDNRSSGDGAGIHTDTDAILRTSTVSGNHAGGNGGGVLSNPYNYLEIYYSTIAYNSATLGGGVYHKNANISGGANRTDYSIVSENVARSFGPDYFGNPHTGESPSEDYPDTSLFGSSDGLEASPFDLVGVDPGLFPLALNGAPVDGGTKTHAIARWGWAVNFGQRGGSYSDTDQRGGDRYVGNCDADGTCQSDLGAFELQDWE
jgi:hypothetical protein